MSDSSNDRRIIDWHHWLASPPGQYVLRWEQAQFDRTVADMFGYHALQLGHPGFGALRENRIPLIARVVDDIDPTAPIETLDPMDGNPAESADTADADPDANTPQRQATPRVICRYDELPFASQSIDLVALPHVLEFTDDPHEVLREVARVLMPEGRLVITGFNPLSLWGMRQGMRRLGTESFLPAQSQMIAFTRLKDWLKLLGFDIVRGRFGCYCPPNRSDKWLQRTAFMEKAGDRWWPIFGAVYMLQAVKRVRTMRLVGPAWKTRKSPALVPAGTPVATPSGSHSSKTPSATARDGKSGV
ncbi:MAG: methyltransferase domain-containing protein [Ralstonia sp.]|uniref:Class I SAM-dependent methyltransferase n=1 Tax=Ralstonia pickettii TaxID=329 RepID=A0AAW4Q3Q0_RALPI|nr:class I SAM-dependent methyltransferase [Ralstonia pickettii]MBX3754189.1 class I SAM-dependent methyltransferase [Ralstonia pickettii]MBX3767312.1 class I SAM-dependent methyltransferase [Ralstonia pickettii]MBX3778258.1 class I SAM-dependent methyltransferase [Ralstonia pickettii]MBX3782971.1 class I SAM-dependent methyltransferase [Ralstonia pickettii]MBX3788408.1 class I SAM-dependent methyltransferase [Ralstonia pickettii]